MWTRIVSVRETTDSHLEIVFDERANKKHDGNESWEVTQDIELQEGELYGSGLEDHVRRTVIPGKKYGTRESRSERDLLNSGQDISRKYLGLLK